MKIEHTQHMEIGPHRHGWLSFFNVIQRGPIDAGTLSDLDSREFAALASQFDLLPHLSQDLLVLRKDEMGSMFHFVDNIQQL